MMVLNVYFDFIVYVLDIWINFPFFGNFVLIISMLKNTTMSKIIISRFNHILTWKMTLSTTRNSLYRLYGCIKTMPI